eukprot:TRINITY_DN28054_c0_g1_i2.p1 TRINITY_DN28054_c0_g1~~TRINITY_DN28054_c0_g1_i2.p1  ORF type:complete len:188 (-),score=14.24 TRINITY_DN28054_c0_g1_i2:4-567(-)
MWDACLLLTGRRLYREFPPEWAERHLRQFGFQLDQRFVAPRRYTTARLKAQLDSIRSCATQISDSNLSRSLHQAADVLGAQLESHGIIEYGEYYVLTAWAPSDVVSTISRNMNNPKLLVVATVLSVFGLACMGSLIFPGNRNGSSTTYPPRASTSNKNTNIGLNTPINSTRSSTRRPRTLPYKGMKD